MIEIKQFNAKTVLPKDDAVLWDLIINRSGVIYGCALSHVASNQVSITAGFGMIKGRLFVISAETIACAQTSSGSLPGRIYIKLDLANTTTPIAILTTCASPLPDLVQTDINITNGVYELELATYTANTTSISDLVTTVGTIENVNKVMLGTVAEVLANTEDNRVVDALVVKEIINSLTDTVLWTNPSPTSVFASQSIALSETLSNFSYYEIIYELINTITDMKFSTGRIPVDSKTRLVTVSSNNAYREISALGGTNITFLTGFVFATYGGGATNNTGVCIPYKVIGHR